MLDDLLLLDLVKRNLLLEHHGNNPIGNVTTLIDGIIEEVDHFVLSHRRHREEKCEPDKMNSVDLFGNDTSLVHRLILEAEDRTVLQLAFEIGGGLERENWKILLEVGYLIWVTRIHLSRH